MVEDASCSSTVSHDGQHHHDIHPDNREMVAAELPKTRRHPNQKVHHPTEQPPTDPKRGGQVRLRQNRSRREQSYIESWKTHQIDA